MKDITIAILAKDKQECLPFYLHCLLNQTYPKDRIHLYIRTNDNIDGTQQILEDFIHCHGNKYKNIYYDSSSVDSSLERYKNHEWNEHRFKVLGRLRQESVNYAKIHRTDYFVADCDNFLQRDVLKNLFDIRVFGVVGPMLHLSKNRYYTNFHNKSCANGYFLNNEEYYKIITGPKKGIIPASTVHCTYLVRNDLLDYVCYDDLSGRYEYAIFSDNLRKNNINQFVDDRAFNGFLFIQEEPYFPMPFMDFVKQEWLQEYIEMSKNTS